VSADPSDHPVGPDGPVEVRHVQPYQAVKPYRCPGCDHEIAAGLGHEVVVPTLAPDLRRHWHSGCWQREQREWARQREREQPRARKRAR
jgi:hypothetical protein